MKILYLQANRGLGNGVSAYIAELTRRSRAPDVFVVAFAPESVRDELARYYGIRPDNLLLIEPGRERNVGRSGLRRIADFVRHRGIGIIHAHTLRAGMLAVLTKLLWPSGVRIVYTNHGIRYLQLERSFSKATAYLADKLVGRVAAATVCLTSREMQVAQEQGLAPERRLSLIRTRIDLDISTADGPRADLILGIGPAGPEKGTDRFVEVAERARLRRPAVRFAWVGEVTGTGPRSSAVAWLGKLPRPAVLELLSAAKGLLFCSRVDTYPIAVLEAYGNGVPVVFMSDYDHADYRAAGMPVIDPDDPDRAAEAVLQLLENAPLAERLSLAAREWFGTFGAGAALFAAEYEALYRRVSAPEMRAR